MIELIKPNWTAPKQIKAFTTTRIGGLSQAPYDQLNLAAHVDDDLMTVQRNREILKKKVQLPHDLYFLKQIHSDIAFDLGRHFTDIQQQNDQIEGDALYSNQIQKICTTLTADCLPVLFCNQQGTEVASAHAGWQGLQKGILEATLAHFKSPKEEIIAWLGPAISAQVFEVGEDVYRLFVDQDMEAKAGFKPLGLGKYLADIYQLARLRLHKHGVTQIYGGDYCTYSDQERFFSYRYAMQYHQGSQTGKTGRMLTAIWIEK